MTDTIKPALTPEEWTYIRSTERGTSVWPQKDGSFYCDFLTDEFLRLGGGDDDGEVDVEPHSAHLLMALCNAISPFGFTREDVLKLRNAPDLYGGLQNGRDDKAWYMFCDNLADRIAALLPPEEK